MYRSDIIGPKRGVALYSYSAEFGFEKTLEDCFEDLRDMGARLGAIYGPESMGLFTEIETLAPRVGNQRGAGVSDMAKAIVEGRKPRVSAELCRHVTEGINALDVSVRTGEPYKMTTAFEMPEALEF